MITDFRRDNNRFVLIEEYKTYWDAFVDPNDAYSLVMQMDDLLLKHFVHRKQQAMGIQGKTELLLCDQNTLWFCVYGKSLKSLSCMFDINQDEIEIICKKNRWKHSRSIISLRDSNRQVDPLDP